jgi:phosphate/phosphite/phosphonate ABC transporter binding protein
VERLGHANILIIGQTGVGKSTRINAVFRIGNATANVTWESYEDIAARPEVAWIVPISLGDSHAGYRVVGTDNRFFEHYRHGDRRNLEFAQGGELGDLFDTVLGAAVARDLGYELGQKIIVAHGTGRVSFVEHDNNPFEIIGILAPTGTPVDRSVFVSLEADGSDGYYAMMYARSESDIHSLEDMQGKSLAFADPNSTSGYLVPRAQLQAAGIDPETYFSRTGFGGGHEQAGIAVREGQYDAGVTWTSGQGDPAQGYSRGNLRRMVDNGLLDMNDLRVIWESDLIPNGPVVIRKDMPEEVKEIVKDLLANQFENDPECYRSISFGDGQGWIEVDHDFFAGIVAMREAELAGSR